MKVWIWWLEKDDWRSDTYINNM